MTHQLELEKKKYRNWVRGGLAYKYLKEGIEGFADDVVQQEHTRILSAVNHTPGLVCSQCCLGNLRPKHQSKKDHSGRKKCPWGQKYCNCMFQNKQHCPNNICEAIMEEILNCHVSTPPAPKWENTDIQQWCSSPWEVGKCFINAPGYSKATKTADIDASGLLHVFINNKILHSHLACSMSGRNIFVKTRERRNTLFHSPTMEMEDTELIECIDGIIGILEDPKELNARHDAQQAVSKLQQLKKQDFIITTNNEVEVCRAALASITKKSEELKQSTIDATKDIDDKMQTAMTNHGDIRTLKQAVELLNKRVNDLESDHSTFRQEIKQRLTKIENSIDTLESARDETTKKLKYVEEKKGKIWNVERHNIIGTKNTITRSLQSGLVKLYQQHYVKTSISPIKIRDNDVGINTVYVSPRLAVDVQKSNNGGEDRKDKTRTHERRYIHGYREIFHTNGHRNKSIYILGDVGTEKSSFCKMMIQNWCTAFTDNSVNSVADNDNSTESGTGVTNDNADELETSDCEWSPGFTYGDTDEWDTSDSELSSVSSSNDDAQYSDGQSSDESGENFNEMRNFDFLFFIPLQRMSRYTEITEMVSATTANLTSRDMIENIFQHDSERCLVLVDGLDEWAPRQQENPLAHVSYGLPDRDKTKQATCVTLSRPSAKGILNLKSSDYDQKVELSGITLKAVKSFIGKYLSKFDKTNVSSKAFMRKVRKAKLKHLQKTPLLLQQLLWLYCTDNEIGTSVSDTYSHLLNIILRWAENKFEVDVMTDQIAVTTEGEYMQLPRLLQRFPACETNERFLLSLSRVAFETLTSERGSGTFGQSYLRKKGVSRDAVTTLIKSGILVEENCFDTTKDNTQLEFIHISYLEFFAAIHVSSYSNEDLQTMDTLKDLFLKCKSAADILQLSNIIKMVCGLSPSLIPELSKFISEIVSRDESRISYRNSMSDFEMSRERQKTKQIQRLIVNCLSENDSDDEPMVSLCDVIINDDTKMSFLQRIIPEHVFSLNAAGISGVEVWRWIAGLKQLQYMCIRGSHLSHSEVVLLLSMIQEAPLKSLSLNSVYCTESGCEGHFIDLSKQDQLQKLVLNGCRRVNISNINTEHLEILQLDPSSTLDINLLLNASRLTVLELGGAYADHYTKQMNSVVHTLQQLRELRLYYINIDNSALTVTPGMKNLEHIELRSVALSLQTWCIFVDSLLTLHQSVQVDADCSVCREINGDGRNYVRQNKMFEVMRDDMRYSFSFRSKK